MSNPDLLENFEESLNPQHFQKSPYFSRVLGYGEISTVFELDGDKSFAYKRMPLFSSIAQAREYVNIYQNYCQYLKKTGLILPQDSIKILNGRGNLVVLYIIQEQLPTERFAHKLIHTLPRQKSLIMLNSIISEISKVWAKNMKMNVTLALDGQLSNWVWREDETLVYVDTSTPLFKINNKEQLNPELFLKSTPFFLRWLIRWFFLGGVMARYYDIRRVYIDLTANLNKERSSDFIPAVLKYINHSRIYFEKEITLKEVEKYYSEDKLIWTLFLAFRKFDSWFQRRILRKRYEFILPEKIKR